MDRDFDKLSRRVDALEAMLERILERLPDVADAADEVETPSPAPDVDTLAHLKAKRSMLTERLDQASDEAQDQAYEETHEALIDSDAAGSQPIVLAPRADAPDPPKPPEASEPPAPPAAVGPIVPSLPVEPRKSKRARRSFEQLLGGFGLAALGAIVVLAGVAALITLAVQRGLWGGIPPQGKFALIAAFGGFLLAVAEIVQRRAGGRSAAGIWSAGIAVLFADAYAGSVAFGVLTPIGSLFMMAAVTAGCFVIALRASSAFLVRLALALGAGVPFVFVRPGVPRMDVIEPLGVWILILLVAGLGLSAFKPRPYRRTRGWTIGVFAFAIVAWVFAYRVNAVPVVGVIILALGWTAITAEAVYAALRRQSSWWNPIASVSGTGILIAGLVFVFGPWVPGVPDPRGIIALCIAGLSGATAFQFGSPWRNFGSSPRVAMDRLGTTLWSTAAVMVLLGIDLLLAGPAETLAFVAFGLLSIETGRIGASRGPTITGFIALILGLLHHTAVVLGRGVVLLGVGQTTSPVIVAWRGFSLTMDMAIFIGIAIAFVIAAWRCHSRERVVRQLALVVGLASFCLVVASVGRERVDIAIAWLTGGVVLGSAAIVVRAGVSRLILRIFAFASLGLATLMAFVARVDDIPGAGTAPDAIRANWGIRPYASSIVGMLAAAAAAVVLFARVQHRDESRRRAHEFIVLFALGIALAIWGVVDAERIGSVTALFFAITVVGTIARVRFSHASRPVQTMVAAGVTPAVWLIAVSILALLGRVIVTGIPSAFEMTADSALLAWIMFGIWVIPLAIIGLRNPWDDAERSAGYGAVLWKIGWTLGAAAGIGITILWTRSFVDASAADILQRFSSQAGTVTGAVMIAIFASVSRRTEWSPLTTGDLQRTVMGCIWVAAMVWLLTAAVGWFDADPISPVSLASGGVVLAAFGVSVVHGWYRVVRRVSPAPGPHSCCGNRLRPWRQHSHHRYARQRTTVPGVDQHLDGRVRGGVRRRRLQTASPGASVRRAHDARSRDTESSDRGSRWGRKYLACRVADCFRRTAARDKRRVPSPVEHLRCG